jgi:hypothetical protein
MLVPEMNVNDLGDARLDSLAAPARIISNSSAPFEYVKISLEVADPNRLKRIVAGEKHSAAPVALVVPSAQSWQDFGWLDAESGLYLPGRHDVQEGAALSEYEPGWQSLHEEEPAPSLALPASHYSERNGLAQD